MDQRDYTGCALWIGGLVLAEWCVRNGKAETVLELGAGRGLPGLTCGVVHVRFFLVIRHPPAVGLCSGSDGW